MSRRSFLVFGAPRYAKMRKIFVTVKPSAKENKIEQVDETHFRIKVKAPPRDGRANAAMIELFADYLQIPKASLTLVSGHTSKTKIVSAV